MCPRWRISALYNSFQKFPDVIRDEGLLIMVSFPAQVITHFTWKAAMLTTIPPMYLISSKPRQNKRIIFSVEVSKDKSILIKPTS